VKATAGVQEAAALGGVAISPSKLAQIVRRTVERPELWRPLVRFEADERWYARISSGDEHEVWLLTWLPGQQTGFHDHGDSRGAFTVASGCLTEQAAICGRPETRSRKLRAGAVRSFGTRYVHDVRNDTIQPAVSIHAYSPPLSSMRRFEVSTDGLLGVAAEERSW
jgi:predicted metal-dependent enzyme (double-stranded beta helix superfamily)